MYCFFKQNVYTAFYEVFSLLFFNNLRTIQLFYIEKFYCLNFFVVLQDIGFIGLADTTFFIFLKKFLASIAQCLYI